MTRFIQYQLINYIRSLKIIPPLTLFIAWIIFLYSYKGVPILSSYAVTSIVLYIVMTWVSMTVFSIEEEIEKHMLFIQLGSKNRYLWGKWAICLMIAIILMLFAILYPVLMNNFKGTVEPIHFALSIYSHFFLALFGILVGSISSIFSFTARKYAWLTAVLIIVVTISYEGLVEKVVLLKWGLILLPPVVNVINYLSDDVPIHIGKDFWIFVILALIYTVIAFNVVIKLFLMKERKGF